MFRAAPQPDHLGRRIDLTRADLTGADLTRADLTRVHLDDADLSGAHLDGVRWPGGMQVPAGWMRDGGSGRLERQADYQR
jgi:hypothetical protein